MLHPQGVNDGAADGLGEHLVPHVQALPLHDVEGQFAGSFGTSGEGFLAKGYSLTPLEQPVQVHIGGYVACLSTCLKQGDAGVDMRQIGSGLRQPPLIVLDR